MAAGLAYLKDLSTVAKARSERSAATWNQTVERTGGSSGSQQPPSSQASHQQTAGDGSWKKKKNKEGSGAPTGQPQN